MPTSPGHRALDLLTDALAAHRLTTLLVEDENPASDRVRDLVHTYGRQWAGAIDCQRCTGVWVGAAVGVLRLVPGWRLVAVPLALAGATALAAELLGETTTGFTEPQGVVAPTPRTGRVLSGPALTDDEIRTGRIADPGGGRALDPDEVAAGRRARGRTALSGLSGMASGLAQAAQAGVSRARDDQDAVARAAFEALARGQQGMTR